VPKKRPQMPLCEALIGCDGLEYIRVKDEPYCGKCKAEIARRTKQKKLRGEHYMEYALATKRESMDG
jgi:hypothetical protein